MVAGLCADKIGVIPSVGEIPLGVRTFLGQPESQGICCSLARLVCCKSVCRAGIAILKNNLDSAYSTSGVAVQRVDLAVAHAVGVAQLVLDTIGDLSRLQYGMFGSIEIDPLTARVIVFKVIKAF